MKILSSSSLLLVSLLASTAALAQESVQEEPLPSADPFAKWDQYYNPEALRTSENEAIEDSFDLKVSADGRIVDADTGLDLTYLNTLMVASTAELLPPPSALPPEHFYHLFKDNEWHFQTFYVRTDFQEDDNVGDGAGFGATYFINRYFGVGGEYFWNNGIPHENSVAALANVRIPLDMAATSISFFAGVGGVFGGEADAELAFHMGGGLEFRLLENVSLKCDARHIETMGEVDLYAFTLGLSYVF